ncbi:MAG: enoyl-CoA hydratase/isomerase family protein, partial [Anaerolineae bacterium]|nr:enoyl-CoA hydratase/isomerase family protein [Anaerolineae bacterium]
MSIEIERYDRVVLVRLNRPKTLNALNSDMMCQIVTTLESLDRDPSVGCFVIT